MNLKEYIKLSLKWECDIKVRVKLIKHWGWINDFKWGVRASLDGASLDGASLDGASLNGASLDGASLDRASLNGASLDGASLDRASLDGASLDRASLDGASLYHASLDRASLDGASLDGASLDGASLNGASLNGASLDGASLYHASLNGASLDGASLDGASLKCGGIEYELKTIFSFAGLYKYASIFFVTSENKILVRMGCHFQTKEDWDSNFWNNDTEFPNDDSLESSRRKIAYETGIKICEKFITKENEK